VIGGVGALGTLGLAPGPIVVVALIASKKP